MDELEKVDIIRKRAGVSYKEAKEALERAGGNVVDALITIEERTGGWRERFSVKGHDLVGRVKQLVKEGNVSRVRVRQGDRTILEFPVTVGVVGALLLPTLAALGVVAAVVANCTIEVQRRRGPNGAGEEDGVIQVTLEEEDEG